MSITKILPKDREDWLSIRQKSIGGSDAAAIVGLNDYVSPYALWLDKTGKLKEPEDNEAMLQGRDLEPYVKERFTRATGKVVEDDPHVIKNSEFPWAHATIDGKISGENAGIECKTVSPYNWNKYKEDGFPYYYYVQCLHYMAVCGFDTYYLAILIWGSGFEWFEFKRNKETEETIQDLMKAEKAFYKLIEDKTPPEVDGSKATDDALSRAFNPDEDVEHIKLLDMDDKAEELASLKEQKKDLDQRIKKIEQEIKSELGDYCYGDTYSYSFSWKPQTRKSFDTKAFEKAFPDIDLRPYYKVTSNRTFRVKKLNK